MKCLPAAQIQIEDWGAKGDLLVGPAQVASVTLTPFLPPPPHPSIGDKSKATSGRCALISREASLSGLSFFVYKLEIVMLVSWKHCKD